MSNASPGAGSPDAHLLAWRELTPEQLAAWSGFLWAHAQVVRTLDRELEQEHGIPLAWFDVLFQLSIARNQRLSMSELADAIVLSESGLTGLVDRLQSRGLVELEESEVDPREIYVRITDSGSELLAQVTPTHISGIKKHFLERLSDKQTEHLAMICLALGGR
jgi:DNA-binding MarR family transcriptional regulator